jgi:DNA-binding transcriptional regulator LsrR (DeoR family)
MNGCVVNEKKLEIARAAAGIEKQMIAARLQISRQVLWRRLTKHRPFREIEIEAIADLLGVSSNWLRGKDHV